LSVVDRPGVEASWSPVDVPLVSAVTVRTVLSGTG
jgi:hypothetical protein